MALYNNGFPVSYPQYYPQIQNNQNIIWVSGEAGAKAYMVAPNNTVQLWDSESQTIYLKSADASGLPSMKILDYTIRDASKNTSNTPLNVKYDNSPVYVTKDEITAINGEIKALKKKIERLMKEEDDE